MLDIEEIIQPRIACRFPCIIDIQYLGIEFLGYEIYDGPIELSQCPVLQPVRQIDIKIDSTDDTLLSEQEVLELD